MRSRSSAASEVLRLSLEAPAGGEALEPISHSFPKAFERLQPGTLAGFFASRPRAEVPAAPRPTRPPHVLAPFRGPRPRPCSASAPCCAWRSAGPSSSRCPPRLTCRGPRRGATGPLRLKRLLSTRTLETLNAEARLPAAPEGSQAPELQREVSFGAFRGAQAPLRRVVGDESRPSPRRPRTSRRGAAHKKGGSRAFRGSSTPTGPRRKAGRGPRGVAA